MLKIICKSCNKELESHPSKFKCCGCENMVVIKNDKISAKDLSLVEIIEKDSVSKKGNILSKKDIEWQEKRKNRKVVKLEFEVR
jgi:hypothetical protein